jgi:hypothetical protein
MSRLKTFEGKDQTSYIPNFLKNSAKSSSNQLSGNFQDDLSCLWIIHGQQIHDLAEHLMSKWLRTNLYKPQMQSQDLNQNGRSICNFRQELV